MPVYLYHVTLNYSEIPLPESFGQSVHEAFYGSYPRRHVLRGPLDVRPTRHILEC